MFCHSLSSLGAEFFSSQELKGATENPDNSQTVLDVTTEKHARRSGWERENGIEADQIKTENSDEVTQPHHHEGANHLQSSLSLQDFHFPGKNQIIFLARAH